VVLSKAPFLSKTTNSVIFSNDFDEAIDTLEQDPNIETIFVIGGEMIYKIALDHPKCEKIYLNMVHVVCDLSKADAFFPEIDSAIYELVESVVIDPTVKSSLYRRL
jgi:dihydrofolate reductase